MEQLGLLTDIEGREYITSFMLTWVCVLETDCTGEGCQCRATKTACSGLPHNVLYSKNKVSHQLDTYVRFGMCFRVLKMPCW